MRGGVAVGDGVGEGDGVGVAGAAGAAGSTAGAVSVGGRRGVRRRREVRRRRRRRRQRIGSRDRRRRRARLGERHGRLNPEHDAEREDGDDSPDGPDHARDSTRNGRILRRPARRGATEESKPDSVSGDHLSARHDTAGPPIARGAPYPGLGEQRQRPCLGLQQGGLPFSLPLATPKRDARALVSVALAIGCPTPACAGHLALRCLDFPLASSKRSKRPPFLRRVGSIPGLRVGGTY